MIYQDEQLAVCGNRERCGKQVCGADNMLCCVLYVVLYVLCVVLYVLVVGPGRCAKVVCERRQCGLPRWTYPRRCCYWAVTATTTFPVEVEDTIEEYTDDVPLAPPRPSPKVPVTTRQKDDRAAGGVCIDSGNDDTDMTQGSRR